jgi:hypothetical protein
MGARTCAIRLPCAVLMDVHETIETKTARYCGPLCDWLDLRTAHRHFLHTTADAGVYMTGRRPSRPAHLDDLGLPRWFPPPLPPGTAGPPEDLGFW